MLVTDTLTGNTGVAQNVKWGGGSFAVNFNNNRQSQSDQFATRNPALNTNLQPPRTCSRCFATSASTVRARSCRSRSSTRKCPRSRCAERS